MKTSYAKVKPLSDAELNRFRGIAENAWDSGSAAARLLATVDVLLGERDDAARRAREDERARILAWLEDWSLAIERGDHCKEK